MSFADGDGLTVEQRGQRNYRRSAERQPDPLDLAFLERRHRTLWFQGSEEDVEFWRAALRRAGRARGWTGLMTRAHARTTASLALALIDPHLPDAPDPAL